MTEADLLAGILQREGGLREATQRPDQTWDPVTFRGVTAPTLGLWRKLGRPATRRELLAMTEGETRNIYRALYIEEPGFVEERVPYEPLRVQLIDFGINSGAPRAVRWLQRVITVPVTGQMDVATVTWLHRHAGYLGLVNEALAAARARMVVGAVQAGTIREEDERGLIHRALSFVGTGA